MLIELFSELYPEPASELDFHSPYQLLISVMLSAQCTDKKVNQVTPTLFGECPSPKALARAGIAKVERIIRPINYYKTKAKNLIQTAKKLVEEHSGEVPRTYEELIDLPGVGRKTANVVLGELGVAHALPVDTHVFRLARRLGLSTGETPLAVEEDLQAAFPSSQWRELHHWLILHGRRVCKARTPLCAECAVAKICPSSTI